MVFEIQLLTFTFGSFFFLMFQFVTVLKNKKMLQHSPVLMTVALDLICSIHLSKGFPGGSDSKESACKEGDLGLNPGLGIFLGGGNSYPLQYSGLENSTDCIAYVFSKSWTRLSNFTSGA